MLRMLFLATLLLSASAVAAPPTYLNLKPGLQKFLHEAQGQDLTKQVELWKVDVESQAPDVYAHIWGTESSDQARLSHATKWFPFFFEHAEAILAQFDAFDRAGWPIVQRLVTQFPEVDFSDIRVLAMPSLMTFNGQSMMIEGKATVGFGMDFIELIAETPEMIAGADLLTDLSVLVAHEFTHALHTKVSDFGAKVPTADGFLEAVWEEGLAEMHSQMLVPGSDLVDVFMERNLAAHCTADQISTWAAAYLADSRGADDQQLEVSYSKWFLMSGWQSLGVPRAGYCLGYNMILTNMRTHSFSELFKMNRAAAHVMIRSTLQDFAAQAQ